MRKRKKNDGLPHRLYERFGKFRYSIRFKPIEGAGFSLNCGVGDLEEIKRIRSQAIAKVHIQMQEHSHRQTLSECFKNYFSWQYSLPDGHVQKKQHITLKGNEEEQKQILKVFGDLDPAFITTAHIRKYLRLRADAGAPAKANKEKSLLSAVYKYLLNEEVVTANPCLGVEKNRTKQKDTLIDDQLRKVVFDVGQQMGGIYEVMSLAFKLAFMTTSRADEIRTLKRVNFSEEKLIIQIGKIGNTGRQRKKEFVVSEELKAIRARLLELCPESEFVICNTKGNQYTKSGWGTNWAKLKNKCRDEAEKRQIEWVDFALTDMRVSSVTYRVEVGENKAEIRMTTGHASEAMINRVYDRSKSKKVKPISGE